MSWVPEHNKGLGNNPAPEPIVDWNADLQRLLTYDELPEDIARKSLGRFLAHNIGMLVEILTHKILEPYQRIVVKGWLAKNFSLTVASRSWGKSTVGSHFAYLYCLLNPDRHILICAATFRSSRQIVERIAEWATSTDGVLLRETIRLTPKGEAMTKRQDLVRIIFKNGSSITAVPLGDPDNLRGFRCNVLLIDEGLLIAQHTINSVLKPFLAGGADATKKQRIRRKEARKIAAGLMTVAEQIRFRSDSKMIILSSASYVWQELYTDVYKAYRAIIEASNPDVKAEETDKGVSSYLVHQLSYKMVAPHLMDPAVLEQIQKKQIPEADIKREYEAQFINESGGFFSARQMNECTIPPGQRPCVEIVGDRNAEYILAIDPAGGSIGADPAGDHFAMCVMKIIPPATKDGKQRGLVVHQYGCAGVDLKHHIAYLYYILKRFKIVYIVIDSTGGENLNFLKVCNESQLFKEKKIELNAIEAEFAKEGFEETVQQVQRSYNPDSELRRIVHNQYFSSSIIKAGNDNLRACFEQKTILFASKAASVDGAVTGMCESDILDIHNSHPEYHDNELEGSSSMYEFVVYQDAMIDLVKKECALIEVTSSPLGHLTYDLPHHMTRSKKNVNRNRKDNYSALWLAAWGLRIHTAAQALPPPEDNTFEPVMMGLPFGG